MLSAQRLEQPMRISKASEGVEQQPEPCYNADHSEQGQHAHLYTPLMRRTFSIKEVIMGPPTYGPT